MINVLIVHSRSGIVLQLHDGRRRWWEEGSVGQVSRSLYSCAKGQLHGLAGGSDAQLQSHAHPIPDCKLHLLTYQAITDTITALREHDRYRLDSIPLPYQLSGRTRDASSYLALNDPVDCVVFVWSMESRMDTEAAVEQLLFGGWSWRTIHARSQEYVYQSLGTRDTTILSQNALSWKTHIACHCLRSVSFGPQASSLNHPTTSPTNVTPSNLLLLRRFSLFILLLFS